MRNTLLPLALLSMLTLFYPGRAAALEVGEFTTICASAGVTCSEVPILRAYVGGALDLVAMLHEETDYVTPIYCKNPQLLFDVSAIIRFIEKHQVGNEHRNTMLLVIRFLEQYGGC